MNAPTIRAGGLPGILRSARTGGIGDPVAWGTIVVAGFLVLGWHFLAIASRPAHTNEIAAEVGSLGTFVGTPVATGDGSRISYFHGTESGGGLFVCDRASGQQQLLYEDAGNQRHAQYGWSPDGRLLAFAGLKDDKAALLIYNVDSGKLETSVPLYGPLKEFAWLSGSSFVFLKGSAMLDSRRGGLMRVDRQSDSNWGQPYHFTKEDKSPSQTNAIPYLPIKGVLATSADSVAWHARNALWQWKFQESAPVRLWRGSSTNRILECDYSQESGEFLLLLGNTNRVALATYSPGSKAPVSLGKIDNLNITNVVWLNHGKGYAYLLNESGSHSLFIKADIATEEPAKCLPQDGVRALATGAGFVFAIGSLDDQPHGIVEYDASSGAARYLVPSLAKFRYAQNVKPSTGSLTNSFGEIHAYRLWAPANFDPHKSYAVVLGQGIRVWNEYAEALANAGAFYLTVERPDFDHPQIQHWVEDVMAAYQLLHENPNIDIGRVYLCGASGETRYAVQLLDEKPTLWKGAVLTSPVDFPDPAKLGSTKLLINCGEADEYDVDGHVKNFQERAAKLGVPVTVAAHHTGHVFISSSSNRESTEQFVKFILE